MDDLIKQMQAKIAMLEQTMSQMGTRSVFQTDITADAVKMRHVGEGVRFIRSGLDANLPTAETPLQGSPFYFATDTNKLYIYNGTAWKSTTLT